MAYRRITVDERADWLLMLEAAGYPDNPSALPRVAKQKGAPSERSLQRWWNNKDLVVQPPVAPSKIADLKRPDLVTRLTHLLNLHIDAATEVVQDSGDLRALDTGIGILTDKIQLLTGQSTSNQDIRIQVRLSNDD